jgi:maltooligosyltrehalose trehalohydrolase
MDPDQPLTLGALCNSETGWSFTVWAPHRRCVHLRLLSASERLVPMESIDRGYWTAQVNDLAPGTLYVFRLDEEVDRPDPASRFQPEGVHGPSAVVDSSGFEWGDEAWTGMNLPETVIYELHVGTFTAEGTFDAAVPRLDALKNIGINAIEIMPVSQFPGERNWGYDGVYPFAVQGSYGGPDGLKRLVNACHHRDMAVILDVVYNHLGPEGNYLWDFGPYFTDRYTSPWGAAMNFDGPYSDEVRRFFIENALAWFTDYHLDGLRLDALHAIIDMSAVHFLRELSECVAAVGQRLGRKLWLIGESDLNDCRLISPHALGGYGLDAVWCDDFHHSLHTLLTGEKKGYYMDFGDTDHLVKALREGFVYSGEYSPFRKRRHGSSSCEIPARQFVVFSQNHDQVGNRMLGGRLTQLVELEALKVAAGVVLLSPYVPLLFMGEEYGERAPFFYFVDHSDPDLVEAVRQGRAREFASFACEGGVPDPQDPETFFRSKLCWESRNEGGCRALLNFYAALIELRRTLPALTELEKERLRVGRWLSSEVVWMERQDGGCRSRVLCLFNFGQRDEWVRAEEITPVSLWRKVLDSSEEAWGGPGAGCPLLMNRGSAIMLKRLSVVAFVSA